MFTCLALRQENETSILKNHNLKQMSFTPGPSDVHTPRLRSTYTRGPNISAKMRLEKSEKISQRTEMHALGLILALKNFPSLQGRSLVVPNMESSNHQLSTDLVGLYCAVQPLSMKAQ